MPDSDPMLLDQELREVLILADSLGSLVAYRYPAGIPRDVVEELKDLSKRARRLYDGRCGGHETW